MKKTKQIKIWENKFGRDYTDRNVVDPKTRIKMFKKMIGNLDIKTILEVGCNKGHNLAALSKIGKYQLIGMEPSEYAIVKGKEVSQFPIIRGNCFGIPFIDSYFDLVFTCGVLIHIEVQDLPKAINEIYRVSKKYILAIEYFSPENTTIHYRGHNDLLWKRDFKKYFLKQKPNLKYLGGGHLEKEDGFDNCNWWLFEKR
ncbi:MAG: methyltransferase domain-containing protein [Candidatus Pacebacteria bacterium]|nr:methyltransferase domain-containing protein [Candidatus Paceibacterota bacterium]